MNRLLIFAFLVWMALPNTGISQISKPGTPRSYENRNTPGSRVRPFELNKYYVRKRIDNLREKEKAKRVKDSLNLGYMPYGIGVDVNVDVIKDAALNQTEDGGRLWLIEIGSPDAKGVQLFFSKFRIPEGAQLFIYTKDRSMKLGAFTSDNNHGSNEFATQVINGDTVILEYYEPRNVEFKGELKINKLIHCFGAVFRDGNFGTAPTCTINVNCKPVYSAESKAVGYITLYDPAINLTGGASGALINSADKKPYFLSANHLLKNNSTVVNQFFASWIIYFNYESQGCENSAVEPSNTNTVSGAALKSRSELSDYMLLELAANPQNYYPVNYLGWDASNNIPAAATGIHHPSGDVKKISLSYTQPLTTVKVQARPSDPHYIDEVPGGTPLTDFKLFWDEGITWGGSSGSPLIDVSTRRIVGQLRGGESVCNGTSVLKKGPDYYGRFSVSWQNADVGYPTIKSILAGPSSTITAMNGDYNTVEAIFSHSMDPSNPYKVLFTDQSTPAGAITWQWNFGDGTSSTLQNPVHSYAAEGEYTVTLTVKKGTETNTNSKTIIVSNDLESYFTLSVNSGVPPLDVTLNSSQSTGVISGRTWLITPSTGFTYLSGNANAINPSIRFNIAGTYFIKLRVSDGVQTIESPEKTVTVETSTKIVPDFEWTQPVYAGRVTTFKDRSLYPCVSGIEQQWTFDSFGTGSGSTYQYVFQNAGTFPVKLVVSDACGGMKTITKQVQVLQPNNANFFPSFTMNKTSVRKGQRITFYDNSYAVAPDKIQYWTWWFEQPGDLGPAQNPVQNNQNLFYNTPPNPNQVAHKYETAGMFTVRLIIGTKLEDLGVWMDQKVWVQDTPDLLPGYVDPILQNYSLHDKVLDFAHLGEHIFAYQHSYDAGFQKIEVYTKAPGNGSNWIASGYYSTQSGINQAMKLWDFRIKGSRIVSQKRSKNAAATEPYSYQVLDGVGSANTSITALATNEIPSTLFNPAVTNRPAFSFYGDEMVVMQREADNGIYIYIVKKGADWKSSTKIKTKVASNGTFGKIFMDQSTIVAHVNNTILIYEKGASAWNTTPKTINTQYAGTKFKDIGYAGNTIIACLQQTDCQVYSATDPAALLYEKPSDGWKSTLIPSAKLLLDMETEIDENTKICNSLNNSPNNVSISERYATIRVTLKNGSSSVDRIFVYKKWYDFWVDSYQTYKIKTGYEIADEHEVSNNDILHAFIDNEHGLDEGKVELYNLDNYCMTISTHIKPSFSLSGSQKDVSAGLIELGGGGSAVVNPGASINYQGRNIVLKPGFNAKLGSAASFTGIECDDLYWVR